MSQSEPDLYGDLYGGALDEFAVPSEAEHGSPKEQTDLADAEVDQDNAPKSPSPAPVKSVSPPPASVVPQPVQSIQTYSSSDDYTAKTDSLPITSSLSIVDRHIRPSEMKEEGKMFIGGLNWDTTDDGLKKYFEQFGRVEACTIMRDGTGRSRCFAFLTFEEPASVNAVMVREHYLDGKIIDPKRAIPRQEHQRAQKLFIGGLAATVTSDSMRDFFSQFGKVVDSTVMLDRETGRSKGFGFVSFENANVDPILGFGKLEIDGKLIDVKLATPRHTRDNMGGYQEDGGQGGYSRGGGGNFTSHSGDNFSQGAQAGAQTQGNTPFDPQALAALYTRMFQQFGGATGMGMGGNMGAMGMGGMGMGAAAGGFGAGGMGGMNRMGGGNQTGAGRGGGTLGPGPVNAPRGPRSVPTGPSGGVGPQRSNPRGHSYHPYNR